MLEEKLRQASLAGARARKRTLWLSGAGLLAAIALIAMLSFFQHAAPRTGTAQLISPHASQTTQPPSHQPIDQAIHSSADQHGLREQFLTRLQTYQSGLETKLAGANLQQWRAQQAATLTAQKQAAVSAFGAGDYAAGLEKLTELEAMARKTLAARDALFADEIAAVKQALSTDDVITAKLHISRALQMKTNDPQTLALARLVQALPDLLFRLKKAHIAHLENHPRQELAWLNKAAELAPGRNGLQQRREALAQGIRQARFSKLISRGLSAVENNDMVAARLNDKKAGVLYPSRPELRILNTAIDKRSDILALKLAMMRAGKARRRDDWRRAQSVYAKAVRRFPDNKDIRDGLQLAFRLISLQTALGNYLGQPERLASPNIFAAARNTLIQAHALARNSPTLARKAVRLQTLLDRVNIKIPVLVKSDNQTFIRIRGVGKVGIISARTIRLKPGTYTFEGIRPGYKSKLVRVRLPVGKISFEVEVVCDERI